MLGILERLFDARNPAFGITRAERPLGGRRAAVMFNRVVDATVGLTGEDVDGLI